MKTFEGIEVVLSFGDLRGEGSYVFTEFSSRQFLEFVRTLSEEFIIDIKKSWEAKNER